MKKYNFTVLIEMDPDTNLYVGEVPGLTGCHSQGETVDELMNNMKEVIELCLEAQKEDISHIPRFVGVQQIEVVAS